jgi:hypothetical protein
MYYDMEGAYGVTSQRLASTTPRQVAKVHFFDEPSARAAFFTRWTNRPAAAGFHKDVSDEELRRIALPSLPRKLSQLCHFAAGRAFSTSLKILIAWSTAFAQFKRRVKSSREAALIAR